MEIVKVVLLIIVALAVFAVPLLLAFSFLFHRLKRQPQNQGDGQQSQSPIANTTSVMERVGKGFVIVLKILAVLVVLLVVSAIFSCGCNCINWAYNDVAELREAEQEYKEERVAEREAEKEATIARKEKEAAVKEERARFEEVQFGIRRWLSSHYAIDNKWVNLNTGLRDTGAPTGDVALVFPVSPCEGMHLPPLDLALAPAGTCLFVEDKGEVRGYARDLWVIYQGRKQHTRTNGRVSVSSGLLDTPSLLLENNALSNGPPSASICTLTVQYTDFETAQLDRSTRLSLEKVFREGDFDRPIKVMDLPSVIDGVPVSWDMVVRCYPAWETDPDTNMGRWMPSSRLDAVYLDHHYPVMLISHDADESEEVKESSGDSFVPPPFPRTTVTSGLSEVLRDVVESVFSEFTEVSSEEFIWWDSQNLLNKGVLMTSSEDMIARIYSWRDVNGYDANEWKGGESLHLFVKKFPDNVQENGVTVRVILRVRLRALE